MREYPQYKLRMSPELKEAITKQAEKNNRSINAEIVLRLERSLAQDNGNEIVGLDSTPRCLERYTVDEDKFAVAIEYLFKKAIEEDMAKDK